MIVVWVLVGAVLLAVELHHLAFFACFGALGAAAAAAVAVAAPSAVALQIGVAIAVTALGVVAIRPWVSTAFARRHDGTTVHGVHGGLIGARATTLDEVPFATAAERVGHIRLLGETWLAVAAEEKSIAPATPVVVVAVSGTTLTVKQAPVRELQ